MGFGRRNAARIIQGIGDLAAFKIGNVSGRWYPDGSSVPVGKLPAYFRLLLSEVTSAVYVIFSYATPIAWRSASGAWCRPPVAYSRTTSQHQSLAAQGIQATKGRYNGTGSKE